MHGPTRILWASLTLFSLQANERPVSFKLGRIVAFAIPLIILTPDLLTYSVPRFLKRQCDRTLGRTAEDLQSAAEGRAQRAAGGAAGPGLQAQADRSGPASAGAVKCPQRFPQQIVFVWRFCMGAHGA